MAQCFVICLRHRHAYAYTVHSLHTWYVSCCRLTAITNILLMPSQHRRIDFSFALLRFGVSPSLNKYMPYSYLLVFLLIIPFFFNSQRASQHSFNFLKFNQVLFLPLELSYSLCGVLDKMNCPFSRTFIPFSFNFNTWKTHKRIAKHK